MVESVPAWQSLLLVRRYSRLVAVSVVVCTVVAALLALAKEPTYEARTQFFVSTATAGADIGDSYRGELFSQQRVASYAQIVSSTELLRAVAEELRLTGGTRELQGKISASVLPETVLIDVTARDASAARAQAIAGALARRLPRFITELETPPGTERSPVRVSVTRRPELPRDPVSPDIRLHLALGLLAGLAVGLGGVALRAAFDDRIRSIDAIERIAGAPVVGSVAEEGDGRGPVVLLDDPLSGRAEDYRRLRTQLRARWGSSTISSLIVSSAGGNDGKTLVAANLGVALAHGGQRVALVDGDLRARRLSELFGLRSTAGLAEVLAGDLPPDEALTRLPELPLAVVGAGAPQPEPGDLLGSRGLPAVIAALREHADVVIVDAPSLEHGADASSFAAVASAMLLVARLNLTRAAQLESAAHAIGLARGPVTGVVVNRGPGRRRRRRAAAAVGGSPARKPAGDTSRRADDVVWG
jgi:capsular exopolysaccharide synthesis family protein